MKKVIYILTSILLFAACKKEHSARDFRGTYTGTFRTIVNQKMVSTAFEMVLIGQNFKVNKGTKLSSGKFKVEDSKMVSFTDEHFWTADFDWNLILNGSYTYEAKGDSLILTKNIYSDPAANTIYNYYQYRLKRSK